MASKLMDLLQRNSFNHSILCKSLVRLEDFCLLFSFSLKCYKYFFSILLSCRFRHWDGYITTTDKLKWLVWGYRYTQEQKDWWLKRENCFKLFRELLFLSLGFWEQLKKMMNEYEHCMSNLMVSDTALVPCSFSTSYHSVQNLFSSFLNSLPPSV